MRVKILYGLAVLLIMAGQAFGSTTRYEFVEGQSTVVQTGGFAGVHITYSVAGRFVLTADFGAGLASFDEVDATLSEIGLSHTQSLNELFNMTELAGTVISGTQIHFVGKTTEVTPVDVNIMVTLADGSVVLTGGTFPPCCDFFIYTLDAVAVESTETIYVDADANGLNNGTSWADAYNYLQDALSEARSAAAPFEIRVAQGIYTPDCNSTDPTGTGDRRASFRIVNKTSLKGGYAGYGELDPNARDVEAYKTILSGDLNGDDVDIGVPCDLLTEPTRAENSYHVVTGNNTDPNAVLDGFTITGGNANGSWQYHQDEGGGIHNYRGSPRIGNCTISANSARFSGGGMLNEHHSSPTITNCTFSGNMGGGMRNYRSSNSIVTNCTFSGNMGGGMCNADCSPTITNCTFSGNSAERYGGGMFNDGESTLINCTFSGNWADHGGGMYILEGLRPMLSNCVLTRNSANVGGGMYNLGTNTTVTNSILWHNTALSGAQIYNNGSTPVITYSNIQGGSWPGEGNIDADPCFADANNSDYHLKSQAGRWEANSESWVQDDVTSPCIDAGDMNSPVGLEPFPNGGIINMGVYGGTVEASKSYFGEPVCETIVAGDINGDCKVNFLDFRLMALHWLEDNAPLPSTE